MILGMALWLRCKLRGRGCGRVSVVEEGLGGGCREGEASLETSSALPSSDKESLTCDLGWLPDWDVCGELEEI